MQNVYDFMERANDDYDLIHNNCQHFARDLLGSLTHAHVRARSASPVREILVDIALGPVAPIARVLTGGGCSIM